MANNGIQRLSPELKWNLRVSLSFCLKPLCAADVVYETAVPTQARRQRHSIGCGEEIPVEEDTATGFTTGFPAANAFPFSRSLLSGKRK